MDSVNYIVSAKHYGGSGRQYLRNMQQAFHRRGKAVTIKNLDSEPLGTPVYARVWQGQWIADCECKGSSFIDPDEPLFFCFVCGNRMNGQAPRPVILPANWQEIESLLLQRPVEDLAGLTDLERVGMARAVLNQEVRTELPDGTVQVTVLPLTRSWEPHETADDLRTQQAAPVQAWLEKQAGAE